MYYFICSYCLFRGKGRRGVEKEGGGGLGKKGGGKKKFKIFGKDFLSVRPSKQHNYVRQN